MSERFVFSFLALVTILATSAFALDADPCPFEQGMRLSECQYQKGYNAPARTEVNCGWNVNIDASFIYWHVSQEYMDIGEKFFLFSEAHDLVTPTNVAYQPFEYKPGFKVEAGWKSHYDDWAFFAEYTWLHQNTSYSNELPLPYYWNLPDWFDLLDLGQISTGTGGFTYFPSTLASSWNMHFDKVDVAVTRPFYQGRAVTVSPYAGLRALWITQSLEITANNPAVGFSNATTSNRSHCWSLGPNVGVEGNWLLCRGFRLEGMMSASLLYTSYTKLRTNQFLGIKANNSTIGAGVAVPIYFTASSNDYNALRPNVELGVGLGWAKYFSNNRWCVDLSARYDFLHFWSQNMMRYWTSAIYGTPEPIGDLQFHGLTATARLDF